MVTRALHARYMRVHSVTVYVYSVYKKLLPYWKCFHTLLLSVVRNQGILFSAKYKHSLANGVWHFWCCNVDQVEWNQLKLKHQVCFITPNFSIYTIILFTFNYHKYFISWRHANFLDKCRKSKPLLTLTLFKMTFEGSARDPMYTVDSFHLVLFSASQYMLSRQWVNKGLLQGYPLNFQFDKQKCYAQLIIFAFIQC